MDKKKKSLLMEWIPVIVAIISLINLTIFLCFEQWNHQKIQQMNFQIQQVYLETIQKESE